MAGNPFSGLFSTNGEGSASSRVGNPFDGLFEKAAAPPVLTPVNKLPQPKPVNVKQGVSKVLDDVGHVAAGAAKTVTAPVVGLAKTVNSDLVQPAVKQAGELGQLAEHPSKLASEVVHGNPQVDAVNKEYQANVKAGKVSSIVDQTVKSNYDPQTLKTIVNQSVANKQNDAQTQKVLATKLSTQASTTNKITAEAVGTASLGVGGGEVGDVVKAAVPGAEKVAEEEAPGIVSKIAGAVKGSAKLGTSGAVGNEASAVQAKSGVTQSPKQVAENLGEGYAGALAAGAAGKVVGKVAGAVGAKIFGKAPDEEIAPVVTQTTKIPVTDESTGTTKGVVSNTLPKSPTATSIPVQLPRPSADGYTDFDLRSQFNAPAKQVAKDVPQVLNVAAKTGVSDPLTAVTNTLADTSSKPVTGKIVDGLLPDIAAPDRNELVNKLVANKDPQEAANLLYDAAKNHETNTEAANNLQGTPMAKQISFGGKSDVENAQRAQLHSRIGQINSQFEAHNNGTRQLAQPAIDRLTAERQTAQDVLDGKKDFATTYPSTKVVGVDVPATKPLPFGDKSETGIPPTSTGIPGKTGKPTEPISLSNGKGLVDKLPAVTKGDTTRQAIVNRKAIIADTKDTYHEKEATAAFKTLSKNPTDIKLVEKLETDKQMTDKEADDRMLQIAKTAKNPKAFVKYARIIRQDYDTLLAHRQALHPETQKLSNYFAHAYDRTDAKTAAELDQRARPGGGNKPGYTQRRVIPTYAEAEKLGLKRANLNVHQDYLDAIHQSAQENGKAALVKGLQEAHGIGSVSNKVGFDAASGKNFDALQIPGGKGLTMTQKLADFYNSRAPSKLSTTPPEDRTPTQTARAGYKVVNKGGKNVVLAGGLFHGLRTGITTAGHQLFNIKNNVTHPISALADNLRLIGETGSSAIHNTRLRQLATDNSNNIDGKSTLQRMRLADVTYTSKEIQGDLAGKAKEGGINRIPGLKQAHSAVFDRMIPGAKAMIFHQLTRKLDSRVPTDLAKMRQIGAGINRGLGGIDNAVDGLSPKAASAFDNIILGRDLNEGILETVGHAFKPNATDGRVARQFVAGSAVVSALPGLATLVATGKLNVHDPEALARAFVAQVQDPQVPTPWKNAPTASQPNGTPISLKLPTTFVSLISKIITPALDPSTTFSGSRTSGLQSEATGRLAFAPALGEKLATNKDFYGQPIYGNGISPAKTALNVANQVAPIPASQISRTAAGNENKAELGFNELGLRASTSTLPSSSLNHSQALNDFYNTRSAVSASRLKTTKQMQTLVSQGKPNQADRLAQEWNATLNNQTKAFRTKYAKNYNPAWDDANQGFTSLLIKTGKNSTASRLSSAKETAAIER